jgi:hypothetical protein
MSEAKSYAAPQQLDEVMIGGAAGVVLESRHPAFAAGDTVVGMGGWQEHAVVEPGRTGMLMKVDTSTIPLSAYLGPVGMPGFKVTGAVDLVGPGADAPEVVTGHPTFRWVDDTSEDLYRVNLFDPTTTRCGRTTSRRARTIRRRCTPARRSRRA